MRSIVNTTTTKAWRFALPFQLSAVLFGASPQELDLKRIEVAPGFHLRLFAAEPALKNPVAFSIDERGRAFVVETHRYGRSIFDITQNLKWLNDDLAFRNVDDRAAFLLHEFAADPKILTADSELVRLVEDRDGDGKAETSSVFAEDFRTPATGTAAGIVARNGNVWFGNIPDLWQLQDSNSPGGALLRRKLLTGFGVHIGVTGHDLHGLTFGHDGRLYFSIGDRGASVVSQEGRRFDYPDTGAVFRCNPDGSNLELFASGLRNPQDLAFDDLGNLWTVDNDTAGPDKSRLLNVVERGDYGWRCSYQHQEGFGPWVKENAWEGALDGTIPHSGEVSQGPAGLAFYPGTGFPERFNNNFFICDFPGGVWSFSVDAKGAGYQLHAREKFLWKLWPTDLDFGPDSRLYVLDWVDGWQMPEKGRIYAVEPNEAVDEARRTEVQTLLREGLDQKPVAEWIRLLSHPDLRVRREAQFILARQPKPPFEALRGLLSEASPRHARLHAIWALGQIFRTAGTSPQFLQDRIKVESALIRVLSSKDEDAAAQAAGLLGEWRSTKAAGPLQAALRTTSPRAALGALLALAKIGRPECLPALVTFAIQNGDRDPLLVHGLATAATGCTSTEQLATLSQHADVSVRRMALLVYRRQHAPAIARFLQDPEARLSYEAARAINDVPIPGAMKDLAATLANPSSPENTRTRAINAHFRLGGPENAQALAVFAAAPFASETARIEALEALQQWPTPSRLDRVMGLWRPLGKRPPAPAQLALESVFSQIASGISKPVTIALARASASLKPQSGLAHWSRYFLDSTHPAEARREALLALAAFGGPEFEAALGKALDETKEPSIRSEALHLASRAATPAFAQRLITEFHNDPQTTSRQAILTAIAKVRSSEVSAFLLSQSQLLSKQESPEAIRLELFEALENSGISELTNAARNVSAAWGGPNSSPHAAPPEARLKESLFLTQQGGDPIAGRRVFEDRADVACLRCHAIKGRGGNVGPALDGLAKRSTRAQILESILLPNAQIATGYESVTITLRNGTSIAGTIKKENASELLIDSPEDGVKTLAKSQVLERRRGLSAMPDNLGPMLNRRDLRDLLEFLSGLR